MHTQENTLWGIIKCTGFAFCLHLKKNIQHIFWTALFLIRWVLNNKWGKYENVTLCFDIVDKVRGLKCHHEIFPTVCDFPKRDCSNIGSSIPRTLPEKQLYVFFIGFKLFSPLIFLMFLTCKSVQYLAITVSISN